MLVNPISFRLSISTFWNSTWNIYNKVNYKYLFYSDLVFFEYFMFFFRKTLQGSSRDAYISHLRLYRIQDKIILNIYYHSSEEGTLENIYDLNNNNMFIDNNINDDIEDIVDTDDITDVDNIDNIKNNVDLNNIDIESFKIFKNILKLLNKSKNLLYEQIKISFDFDNIIFKKNLIKNYKKLWNYNLEYVIKPNLSFMDPVNDFKSIIIFLKNYYFDVSNKLIDYCCNVSDQLSNKTSYNREEFNEIWSEDEDLQSENEDLSSIDKEWKAWIAELFDDQSDNCWDNFVWNENIDEKSAIFSNLIKDVVKDNIEENLKENIKQIFCSEKLKYILNASLIMYENLEKKNLYLNFLNDDYELNRVFNKKKENE